jgi:uncharacterized protein (TIGR02300 family)
LASQELGAKQICPTCQTKFYDLGRRPAACPKCGTAFDPEEALRTRRVRARSTAPDYEADEEQEEKKRVVPADEEAEGFEDEAEDTPEIDEAAEAEPLETDEDDTEATGAPEAGEPDLGVDFEEDAPLEDEGEDVPFLEEEDEDFPEDEIEGLPDDDREER